MKQDMWQTKGQTEGRNKYLQFLHIEPKTVVTIHTFCRTFEPNRNWPGHSIQQVDPIPWQLTTSYKAKQRLLTRFWTYQRDLKYLWAWIGIYCLVRWGKTVLIRYRSKSQFNTKVDNNPQTLEERAGFSQSILEEMKALVSDLTL